MSRPFEPVRRTVSFGWKKGFPVPEGVHWDEGTEKLYAVAAGSLLIGLASIPLEMWGGWPRDFKRKALEAFRLGGKEVRW